MSLTLESSATIMKIDHYVNVRNDYIILMGKQQSNVTCRNEYF